MLCIIEIEIEIYRNDLLIRRPDVVWWIGSEVKGAGFDPANSQPPCRHPCTVLPKPLPAPYSHVSDFTVNHV